MFMKRTFLNVWTSVHPIRYEYIIQFHINLIISENIKYKLFSNKKQIILPVQTLSSEFILADDFKTKCCKFSLSELATPTVYSEWVNVKASLVLEFAFTKKENKFITDDDTNSIQCVLPIEIIKPGVFRYTEDKNETNLTSLDLEREFMVTPNKQKRRMWIS
eukprot:snap_masked-scaffold_30-processed-gene-0.26-mRNA-1 protein AED:1.00 eAED:1.00 QI:0/0/0/0/1/1/2/0/161